MANFSPSWFNFFKKNDAQAQATPDPNLTSNTSALLALTRAKRPLQNSYTHQYEVVLVQSGSAFGVEMRSEAGYEWNGRFSSHTQPWIYQKTFNSFPDAKKHFDEILADAHEYGKKNRPDNWLWRYWSEGIHFKKGQVIFSYQRPAGVGDGQLAAAIMLGESELPDDLSAGEVVRQLWGSNSPSARAALLKFAKTSSLAYGYWSHWKWLYKQAEANDDFELLSVFITRLDNETFTHPANSSLAWIEQWPSAKTIGYMKRRARRYLKGLALRNPAQYVALASQLLKQPRTALDPTTHWITFDILYGHSGRYLQSGHGRGGYILRQKRPSLKIQDERAPEAWNGQQAVLFNLYRDANLPWQIQEWALKMLLRRKVQLPPLPIPTFWRFVHSSSPLLVRAAVERVVALDKPLTGLNAEGVAQAYFLANGTERRQIAAKLVTIKQANWNKSFATKLCQVVTNLPDGTKYSRRRVDATSLLARQYYEIVQELGAIYWLRLIPGLVASRDPQFDPLLKTLLAKINGEVLSELLRTCAPLQGRARQRLADLLVKAFEGKWLHDRTVESLIFSGSAWEREMGWRLLGVAKNADSQLINSIWDRLFWPHTAPQVLASATSSTLALSLLLRSTDKMELLQERFRQHPAILAQLSTDSFAMLIKSFPLEVTQKLLAVIPALAWSSLQTRLIEELRADGRLGQFWRNVWNALNEDAGSPLKERLLDEPIIAQTFIEACDPTFLEMPLNPAFSALLVGWMEGHTEHFGKGSRVLLAAAMHKAPEVRQFALRRLDEVGLSLPFALRLLESGLPQSIEKGKQFFEAVPSGKELDYALAICDSPDKNVQAYGREYLAQHKDVLPVAELTRRLAEHPDPLIQEIVAQTLLEQPQLAAGSEITEFDRAVLRRHDKGRRVKEMVKKQVSSSEFRVPSSNSSSSQLETRNSELGTALVELAQGRTKRDAEWAWQELTRRALAGEKIEGFEVLGITSGSVE
jgi:hypothetical protein